MLWVTVTIVQRPAVVLFDLDGTLVDSAVDIYASFRAAWAECFGERRLCEERLRVGPPLGEMIEALDPSLNATERKDLVRAFREHYDTHGFVHTKPYPNVTLVLSALRDSGAAVFVATNKREEPARRLVSRCFDGYFSRVLSLHATVDGETFTSKSQMIVWAANHSSAEISRAVMVGDSPEDILAARTVGARAIAVTWGYGDTPALRAAAPDVMVSTTPALGEALGVFSQNAP